MKSILGTFHLILIVMSYPRKSKKLQFFDYAYCQVNVSSAVGPKIVDRAINNLLTYQTTWKCGPYNMRPRIALYLLWFLRYRTVT